MDRINQNKGEPKPDQNATQLSPFRQNGPVLAARHLIPRTTIHHHGQGSGLVQNTTRTGPGPEKATTEQNSKAGKNWTPETEKQSGLDSPNRQKTWVGPEPEPEMDESPTWTGTKVKLNWFQIKKPKLVQNQVQMSTETEPGKTKHGTE